MRFCFFYKWMIKLCYESIQCRFVLFRNVFLQLRPHFFMFNHRIDRLINVDFFNGKFFAGFLYFSENCTKFATHEYLLLFRQFWKCLFSLTTRSFFIIPGLIFGVEFGGWFKWRRFSNFCSGFRNVLAKLFPQTILMPVLVEIQSTLSPKLTYPFFHIFGLIDILVSVILWFKFSSHGLSLFLKIFVQIVLHCIWIQFWSFLQIVFS